MIAFIIVKHYYYKYNSHTYKATLINTLYMKEYTEEENKLEINLINDNINFTNLSHLKNINFDIFKGIPKLFNILKEYNTDIISYYKNSQFNIECSFILLRFKNGHPEYIEENKNYIS